MDKETSSTFAKEDDAPAATMTAARIHRFGPPQVIGIEEVPKPEAGRDEVIVRNHAVGVGPWDAWIRAGKSVLPQPLPLILGSDFSGIVESVGQGVENFHPGDAVYGVANKQFTNGYAEYVLATAAMIARKPETLDFIQAASVPVVAVTAWQALFDYAKLIEGQSVLVHGAAGNVGSYAVQLAKQAGAKVIAVASAKDADYVRGLGAGEVIDYRTARFEDAVKDADVVLDTVGGDTLERSYGVLKPGGHLISIVAQPSREKAQQYGIQAEFILVDVTTERLSRITELIDSGQLKTDVGEILPLSEAVTAHEMLEGRPHKRGKIVLRTGGAS